MRKLLAILDLFRKGSAVTNPDVLHDRALLTAALTAVITAAVHVLHLWGVDLPIDTATADRIAGGIAAAYLVVMHYTSSPERGLPGLSPVAGAPGQPAAGGPAAPAGAVGGQPAQPVATDPVRRQPGDPLNADPYLPG